MTHTNVRSVVCVLSPSSVVPVIGVSDNFIVVGKGFAGAKPKKLLIGLSAPAAGTLSVQAYYKRAGVTSAIFGAPIGMDTTADFISSSAVNNVTLIEGDILTFELVTFTGLARGVSVTLDLAG